MLLLFCRMSTVLSPNIMAYIAGLFTNIITKQAGTNNSQTITHWVMIVGKNGREYLVMDPLNREKTIVPLSTLSKKIYSIRMVALN